MHRRDREARLEGVNLLEITPQRTADWEDAGDRVVVLRPPPRARGVRRPIAWLLYHMAARRIRLDAVGSAAWKAFDGRRTVEEIAGALRAQFGDAVEPAEERLGHLVRVLRREELLAYPGWDDPAAPPDGTAAGRLTRR